VVLSLTPHADQIGLRHPICFSQSKRSSMSDKKSKAAPPPGGDRINRKEEFEVEGWAKRLGVSPQELKRVMKKVGPMLADVKKELGK
jgi:hypothetical protein